MIGVSVVIGTHVAIAGRNASGDLFHLGFWPDSTGAHALGSQGLAAIWRHMLGLGPETSLVGRALARWDASDPEELLHLLTRIGAPEDTQAARFADAVLDEADAGDAVAATIVETVAGRMGDYAQVCAERTGQLGAPFPLVLCGSVLRHPSPLLRSALLARVPDGRPVYPDVEPVAGAVLLAADRIGARPDVSQLRVPLPLAMEAGG
jgi:N-acetylglucosamine kinase-like BadF-type ATPase